MVGGVKGGALGKGVIGEEKEAGSRGEAMMPDNDAK